MTDSTTTHHTVAVGSTGTVGSTSDPTPGTGGWRRTAAVLAVLALLVTLAGCGDDGGDEAADGDTSRGLGGLVRPEPLEVGAITLPIAATGQPRTMTAQPGQLLVVYFGYLSCPDVCPTTMADLESAFSELDPDDASRIEVAFVTVDPDRDDAAKLADYLDFFFERAQGLRPESPEQLTTAEDAFLATSAITPDPDGGVDVTHSATTYAVDEAGTVLVEWAFGTAPEVIAADLEILLAADPAT